MTPLDLSIHAPRHRREVTHHCEYVVVWSTKFARPVLDEYIEEVEDLLKSEAASGQFGLTELVVTPSAVSIRVTVDPTVGIHRAVTRLKSASSSALRARHSALRKRIPSLWNSKYMVTTVGTMPAALLVTEFLEQQRRV
ncbi:IS200/IS605 family transposase [Paucibacter soli]|uniref:IS200/IS605 family transposase n=1 Tax=Paucibacter soli TaxID=3133433 RepID=UPI004035CA3F